MKKVINHLNQFILLLVIGVLAFSIQSCKEATENVKETTINNEKLEYDFVVKDNYTPAMCCILMEDFLESLQY